MASGKTRLLIYDSGFRGYDSPTIPLLRAVVRPTLMKLTFSRWTRTDVAIITDGKGEIPNGTKIPVPNNKIKWDEGNPTGHGIIFIGIQGQPREMQFGFRYTF